MSGGTEKPRNMDFMGTSFEKPQNCQPGMRKSDFDFDHLTSFEKPQKPGMRKSDWSTARVGTDVSAFP